MESSAVSPQKLELLGWTQLLTPVIPAVIRWPQVRITVQGQPLDKSMRPYLKNNKAKRAGGVAQKVEHLPSKCGALS
jgi:hypothetical protein